MTNQKSALGDLGVVISMRPSPDCSASESSPNSGLRLCGKRAESERRPLSLWANFNLFRVAELFQYLPRERTCQRTSLLSPKSRYLDEILFAFGSQDQKHLCRLKPSDVCYWPPRTDRYTITNAVMPNA